MEQVITVQSKVGSTVKARVFNVGINPTIDLILIHAFPLDSSMYLEMVSLLLKKIPSENGIRIILPDLPGFGISESLAHPPKDLRELVQSIRDIAVHVKSKAPIVGGCSMGGYIALEYSKQFETKGLILMDTRTSADSEEGRKSRYHWAEKILKIADNTKIEELYSISNEIEEYIEGLKNKLLSPKTSSQIKLQLDEIINKQPSGAVAHALLAMAGREDTSLHLQNYAHPSLIIVGEQDVITPVDISRAMVNETRNGRLVIVKHSGHLPIMEQPEIVATAITEWLKSIAER